MSTGSSMNADFAPSAASEQLGSRDGEPVGARQSARVLKHSVVIAGHRTSVSLEDAFWRALKDIAARDGVSLAALIARVDAGRGEANLSSALRVFVLTRVTPDRA